MDTQILTPQPNQVIGDIYVKFQVETHTPAILSMEFVQEVLIVPVTRITPMPNMPECVLGLLNRRNRVLWAIDLAQVLNLQPVDANAQQYHIIIIRVAQFPLALVVQEVKGITRFTPDCIQPPGVDAANIIPYLDGCILQQETLLVMNAKAIVNSSLLHSY
jgi:twitching motility protein PilI